MRIGLVTDRPDASDLARLVAQRLGEDTVEVVAPPDRSLDTTRGGVRLSVVLAQVRRVLTEHDLDAVVVVSERPVLLHGRRLVSHTSPVQRCAVVSDDGAGAPALAETIVRALGDLLEDSAGGKAHHHRPHWRDVPRAVLANRPWLLAARLSRTLTGASAAAFVAVVTPDFWVLADRMGMTRLTVIAALVLAVGTAVLVIGGGLGDQGDGPRAASVEVSVWLSVAIGVLSLYALLVLVSIALTLLVLPPGLVSQTVGHPMTGETVTRLASLISVVSLVGSVFGASLEEDADVQDATLGSSDDARYAD